MLYTCTCMYLSEEDCVLPKLRWNSSPSGYRMQDCSSARWRNRIAATYMYTTHSLSPLLKHAICTHEHQTRSKGTLYKLCTWTLICMKSLTDSSMTKPKISGPSAAPIEPVPSMMADTVALAFWLSLRDLWVPWMNHHYHNMNTFQWHG